MGIVSDDRAGAHRTHVENLKDPVEVGLPTGNCLFIIPRVKNSRDRIAPALSDGLLLYLRNGSAIKGVVQ